MSIRYRGIILKAYEQEKLLEGLSRLLGSEVRLDWIGRAYAVINPYIKNGKYNPESEVYELGSDEKSYAVVENFIMGCLDIMSKFIHINNLFDLLTYELKKIDDYGNYLLIIEPLPYKECKSYFIKFMWLVGILALLSIIGVIIFLCV